MTKGVFKSEAEMCAVFCDYVRAHAPEWTPYPETGDFDILLVHESGYQIGVEAKLRLNAEVLVQASKGRLLTCGPDFRAVLVPGGHQSAFKKLARTLGIQVILANGIPETGKANILRPSRDGFGRVYQRAFEPLPPNIDSLARGDWAASKWREYAIEDRLEVPEYVPDVTPGRPAPVKLSKWKIKAIKAVILLRTRGYITTTQFRELGLYPQLFVDRQQVQRVRRGVYAPLNLPDLQKIHPENYAQILADRPKWEAKLSDLPEDLKREAFGGND